VADDDLPDRVRKAAAKATPGPWYATSDKPERWAEWNQRGGYVSLMSEDTTTAVPVWLSTPLLSWLTG
jgi:hypothetical protein